MRESQDGWEKATVLVPSVQYVDTGSTNFIDWCAEGEWLEKS